MSSSTLISTEASPTLSDSAAAPLGFFLFGFLFAFLVDFLFFFFFFLIRLLYLHSPSVRVGESHEPQSALYKPAPNGLAIPPKSLL